MEGHMTEFQVDRVEVETNDDDECCIHRASVVQSKLNVLTCLLCPKQLTDALLEESFRCLRKFTNSVGF